MKIGSVIVAAGYGSCRSIDGKPFPKVLEDVGGTPLLVRVVNTVGLSPSVVIVNPLFGPEVQSALERNGFDGEFMIQPHRRGSADAVMTALPRLKEKGVSDVLVAYGDMPLFSKRTAFALLNLHLAERPLVSMVSASLNGLPPLYRYGRVLRDEAGAIKRIVEPADAEAAELAVSSVNPSLWIWNVEWLIEHIPLVPFKERPDGLAAERYLPPLIAMAREEGKKISELPLLNHIEALGVNTAQELQTIRNIIECENH